MSTCAQGCVDCSQSGRQTSPATLPKQQHCLQFGFVCLTPQGAQYENHILRFVAAEHLIVCQSWNGDRFQEGLDSCSTFGCYKVLKLNKGARCHSLTLSMAVMALGPRTFSAVATLTHHYRTSCCASLTRQLFTSGTIC